MSFFRFLPSWFIESPWYKKTFYTLYFIITIIAYIITGHELYQMFYFHPTEKEDIIRLTSQIINLKDLIKDENEEAIPLPGKEYRLVLVKIRDFSNLLSDAAIDYIKYATIKNKYDILKEKEESIRRDKIEKKIKLINENKSDLKTLQEISNLKNEIEEYKDIIGLNDMRLISHIIASKERLLLNNIRFNFTPITEDINSNDINLQLSLIADKMKLYSMNGSESGLFTLFMDNFPDIKNNFLIYINKDTRRRLQFKIISYLIVFLPPEELEVLNSVVNLPLHEWANAFAKATDNENNKSIIAYINKGIEKIGFNDSDVKEIREMFNFKYTENGKQDRILQIKQDISSIINKLEDPKESKDD